jgi:hypothetical protein
MTDVEASYDAVDEGTYFVTVIAMNPANDASKAVCSDGVTIVTTKPSVKNVVLNGAKTDPRLVVDDIVTHGQLKENLYVL